MIFSDKHTPRWIIFFIDIFICLFSVVLAYLLRFNFSIPEIELITLPYVIPFILIVRAASFYFAKTYAGIIRYTSTKDAERIFVVISLGSVFLGLTNIITYNFLTGTFIIPYSVIIIDYITTIFIMTASRLLVKTLYLEYKNPSKAKSNVIIFGAGESGLITKRTLDRDAGTKYKVIAFIDDDQKKVGKKLEGVEIFHADHLETLLKDNDIVHLVISMQHINSPRKRKIIETCLNYNTRVLNVPPVHRWINGELSFKQIKKIRIEDLLGRNPIKLDEEQIKNQLRGKNILITGAAGSIGSELVKQISKFKPQKLILLDQTESPLYDLELEFQEIHRIKNIEIVIGDIRNKDRMENLFKTYHPDLVYHAAAYKHVPMMENNPSEAILTNVLGTKIIADLAIDHQVQRFVMISTDKAVNPTNVMGASKRIAEIYTQSLSRHASTTKFITTRFGNVLGSDGSVIPRFERQIEKGGPITVTHPDVTRYFMTISESCQLVLEAGVIGNGGEIFIFDMGKSVKIVDLAKKMVKLSELTLGKDIQIVYTGLRPGEKLYEELLNSHENTLPTHHPQILIAKVKEYDWENISKEITSLIELFKHQNNEEIVKKMKQMVPEFISKNSVYERLDKNEKLTDVNLQP
ncbi:polysaccharide biosynthesis protein [bacterium AH-315-M05]|nr:polysaccharide biosynthesis protein [bacterium AH-315-M05]